MSALAVSLSPKAAAQARQGQARLDSLLAEAPKQKEDSEGVQLMGAIAFGYRNVNPDMGLDWAAKEQKLAQKIGWRKGEANACNDLGMNYQAKGLYPASLESFFKALGIAEELNDKQAIGAASGNIGGIYMRRKDYPKALEYHTKALHTAQELGDKRRTQISLGNIGNVYLVQGRYSEALDYQKQSLEISETLDDNAGIILQTGNIGSTYAALKQYPAAIAAYSKALRIARAVDDKQSVAINLGNLGEGYYSIAEESGAPAPDSLVPAGKAANLAKGIACLNEGIAACRGVQFYEAIPEFSQYLSKAFALQGNYKDALAAYIQYTAVNDSLYNISNNEQIAKLETRRAMELKDKDILIARLAIAKKRNERWFFIGGIALLLAIMGILYRGFKSQQKGNVLLSKEKKRSDDLLLNILPAEVAEELKDHGASTARQYEEVSVLFTDFVDFTGVAQELSPQALVHELHECFTAFDAIIERNGLEKIKTIGDAYMAVCGLPVADPLHAEKTVLAAIDIRNFIEERKKSGKAFEVRIGINSGSVVAGIVGVKKFAFDIWGDAVNTAARMEQHSEPGQINISRSTYDLVKDQFACMPRGKISAKNKGEVEMYFIKARIRRLASEVVAAMA